MAIRGYAIAHEHARPRGGFEDFVHTFNFERRAFFVRTCADDLGDTFALLSGDPWAGVIGRIWMVGAGSEVGFAANKDNRNSGATDRTDFFNPLAREGLASLLPRMIHPPQEIAQGAGDRYTHFGCDVF